MIIDGKELKIGDEIYVYDYGPYREIFSSKRLPRNEKYGGFDYNIVGFTKYMIIFDNCTLYYGRVDSRSIGKTWRFSEN